MKRLPKGYGSVCKLSGNRRQPYAARVTTGKKADGKPQYTYLGYYPTREEALAALADYNRNPYDPQIAQATLADIWEIFKTRRFDKISESGRTVYKAAYGHLKPLHSELIASIRTYQMQRLIDDIPRKWQTKSHVQTLLCQLCEIAVELDIVQKNYARFVTLGAKPKSDIHSTFTDEEIKKLFENVFAEEWADTVLIMIYSGLRPSEMLGIKVEDIHIAEGYIRAGIKTAAGKNRVIPINDKVLPFIKKRYDSSASFLIEENGRPLAYAAYKSRFKALMKALGMDHLPHDGRHTFASLMDTAGANPIAVKRIMGHASQDITDRVYTHKTIGELLKNVNMI